MLPVCLFEAKPLLEKGCEIILLLWVSPSLLLPMLYPNVRKKEGAEKSVALCVPRFLCTNVHCGRNQCIKEGEKEPMQCSAIQMSHWRHTMVDGAEFWISCQSLALLSILSCCQLIQNPAPSTIVWRQCYIRIRRLLNHIQCDPTCRAMAYTGWLHVSVSRSFLPIFVAAH